MPFLVPLHAPHDIIGVKMMPPSSQVHPQLHSVQV